MTTGIRVNSGMIVRGLMVSAVILAATALSACQLPGSSSTPAAGGGSASASAGIEVVGAGGTDPAAAVRGVHECGNSYSCMTTRRLSDRLKAASASLPADVTCRCQNAGTITYLLHSQGGDKALVNMDLGLDGGAKPLRWTVLQVSGSWYADDQDCGSAATSIYTDTGPCPQAAASPSVSP